MLVIYLDYPTYLRWEYLSLSLGSHLGAIQTESFSGVLNQVWMLSLQLLWEFLFLRTNDAGSNTLHMIHKHRAPTFPYRDTINRQVVTNSFVRSLCKLSKGGHPALQCSMIDTT